ncbi:MAG: LPS export ABC transporter periplasmic protein LptC [Brevinema sp.]
MGRNDRIKRVLPSASMQNFLYTYTEKSGYREWEVKAAQATVYEDVNKVYLHNLTMTFFSESNQIKSVLVANKGEVDQSAGNMIAEGEVQIYSSNQSQLLTEKVYWKQQENLFYSETNKLVTYIRPSYKIIGYDMVSDSKLENVEMDNSVGRIDTEKSEETNKTDLPTEQVIPIISDSVPENDETPNNK